MRVFSSTFGPSVALRVSVCVCVHVSRVYIIIIRSTAHVLQTMHTFAFVGQCRDVLSSSARQQDMRTVKMERGCVCVYHMLVLPHNASRIPGVHISHSRRAQQVVRAYRHDARLQGLTVMCLSNT